MLFLWMLDIPAAVAEKVTPNFHLFLPSWRSHLKSDGSVENYSHGQACLILEMGTIREGTTNKMTSILMLLWQCISRHLIAEACLFSKLKWESHPALRWTHLLFCGMSYWFKEGQLVTQTEILREAFSFSTFKSSWHHHRLSYQFSRTFSHVNFGPKSEVE